MLSVNINQDVEQYQEAVMAGFNAKQTVAVIASVLAGAGAVCLGYFVLGIPLSTSVYFAVPCCTPIILSTFGREGDITFFERMKGSPKKQLCYFSTETAVWKTYKKKIQEQEKIDKKKSVRKQYFTLRHSVAKCAHKEKKREGCEGNKKNIFSKKNRK